MATAGNQQHVYKLSCRNCRTRKIKCDRVHPCAPCTRSSLECVFPKPARQPGAASRARNAELSKRLAQLEQLVGNLGPGQTPSSSSAAKPAPVTEEEPGEPAAAIPHQASDTPETPSLWQSFGDTPVESIERRTSNLEIREHEPISKSHGTRYLGSDFWANLSGEVHFQILLFPQNRMGRACI